MIGAYTVATNEPSWGIKRSNCERNSQRIKSEDLINSSFSTSACLQGFKLVSRNYMKQKQHKC